MTTTIRRVVLAVAVGAACTPLLGCTAKTPQPLPSPNVHSCAEATDIHWSNVKSDKVITDASVMIVAPDGSRTETFVAGFPKLISPSVSTDGDGSLLSLLIASLSDEVDGVQATMGPPRASSANLDEELAAGRYVIYAGANRVEADYVALCGPVGGPAQSTITGSALSWAHPVEGILQCDLDQFPPEGSLGVLASSFCTG